MSEIKERRILFSAPMVRAILDGRKTVTRRPVKGAALKWLEEFVPEFVVHTANGLCPFGHIGERLWVRETWYCDHDDVMRGPYLKPDDLDVSEARDDGTLVYAADGLTPYEADQPVWKPSIHMPRWACRILLEITDVRVERLQDISEGQAVDEGLVWEGVKDGKTYWNHVDHRYPPGSHQQFSVSGTDAVSAFRNLWKSTGGDWDANPWVWVVEFKRVTP
ncbi:hypothetical protein MKZ87_07320 [Pseudomonas sp. MCal1]|uniref:hypothetical protein n=1 Tax=Pseudomonas sp. MCal1 TaxID=2919887 RepID=UPI0022510E3A|nr:hypothetical protein [Pseudomonas sp. MCal1]MCX4217447.1 hypothetical protein [Pseudomonas sp. MCal1]